MKISIEQFNLNNMESKYCPCGKQNNIFPHFQHIYFLTPSTSKYGLLHGKRQLRLQMKLNLLNS